MPAAKRRCLAPTAPKKNFWVTVNDDIALYLMQFLDAFDALHLAKSCKWLAYLFKQYAPRLRRFEHISHLDISIVQYQEEKCPTFEGNCGPMSDAYHYVRFVSEIPKPINLTIFNSKTKVVVNFKTTLDDDERTTVSWNCFVENGNRADGVEIIAEFLAARVHFHSMTLKFFTPELSSILSKFVFHVDSLHLDKTENFIEDDLLSWSKSLSPTSELFFHSNTPCQLGQTFFANPIIRRIRQLSVHHRFWLMPEEALIVDFTDDLLHQIGIKNLQLEKSRLSLHGLKREIDAWAEGRRRIYSWQFRILIPGSMDEDAVRAILFAGRQVEPNYSFGDFQWRIAHTIESKILRLKIDSFARFREWSNDPLFVKIYLFDITEGED